MPSCSCAGPEVPAPAAYRPRLEPPELVEVAHCGRSTPWMLGGGAVLVCDEDDAGGVRLAVADGPSRRPVTDGPRDVGAQPLHRDGRRGCAAPP